jgi:hypothetical protein
VQPLGEYEHFARWTGQSRTWGPDERYRVWFAGGALDGLVSVIDDHVQAIDRVHATVIRSLLP